MLTTALEAIGFAFRHGAWALGDEPGPLTPMLITPKAGGVADFLVMPGEIEGNVLQLRAQRDLVAAKLAWTVLMFDGLVNKQDAFVIEWTEGEASGRAFCFYGRDENGFVGLAHPGVSVPEGGFTKAPPEALEAMTRGMNVHISTIEAQVEQ
jgi:hypothetical protein